MGSRERDGKFGSEHLYRLFLIDFLNHFIPNKLKAFLQSGLKPPVFWAETSSKIFNAFTYDLKKI